MKNRNQIYLSVILIVIFVIVLIYASAREISLKDFEVKTPRNRRVLIYSNHILGQTFVARENNIHKIGVALGKEDDTVDTEILFQIKSDVDGGVIRTVQIPASFISKDEYTFFEFKPMLETENQSLFFSIEARSLEKKNALFAYVEIDDSHYPDGNFYVAHNKKEGDVGFIVFYRNSLLRLWLRKIKKDPLGLINNVGIAILILILLYTGASYVERAGNKA